MVLTVESTQMHASFPPSSAPEIKMHDAPHTGASSQQPATPSQSTQPQNRSALFVIPATRTQVKLLSMKFSVGRNWGQFINVFYRDRRVPDLQNITFVKHTDRPSKFFVTPKEFFFRLLELIEFIIFHFLKRDRSRAQNTLHMWPRRSQRATSEPAGGSELLPFFKEIFSGSSAFFVT
jgi:hypothetical protein